MFAQDSNDGVEDEVPIVIRFTSTIPDLPLSVPARTTTVVALKQRIRNALTEHPTAARSRLRLIYAGKVLTDTSRLATVVPLPSGTITPISTTLNSNSNSNGKGKGKVFDGNTHLTIPTTSSPARSGASTPTTTARVYIHCSIGEVLTPTEIKAEADAAATTVVTPASPGLHRSTTFDASSTLVGPQGFDRLLSSSFTASDVAALRSQFLAVLSQSHTPDTLPRGSALRALEDRWLDSDSNVSLSTLLTTPTTTGGSTTVGANDAEPLNPSGGLHTAPSLTSSWTGLTGSDSPADDAAALYDVLLGNLLGFFWPLGAAVWIFREDGVWNQRRQIAVFTGVVVNVGFGVWRLAS